MDRLVSEYGYYSAGESFSVSDPEEVWIMEMIGKGVGNKGAVWVARRIPDGYISGHANQARITTFPLNDNKNCLYSKDVIDLARKMGYFEGKDKDFSFADAYAPLDFEGARFCEARVWSGFSRVNSEMIRYEDYAMGENLQNRMPLWIKPEKKLTVRDVMSMMRDYYQGTKMDMTQDFGAGPYASIVRWRPLTWEVDGKTYFNERATSTQQTGFSFVAQARNWLPDPVGGILWFGVDDTYSTVYVPLYCGINKAPMPFARGNGALMEFSDSSAFWVFNQVSNYAYTMYNHMIPFIQEKQSALEYSYLGKTGRIDKEAGELYRTDREAASELLTNFSVSESENLLQEWKSLYAFLFTRFMDGNIKTPVEGQQNPHLEQPGYSDFWYKKLVDETGDKFLIRSNTGH
jgi:dipeptidase